MHHATSAPAVDLLDMSTTPPGAKSSPQSKINLKTLRVFTISVHRSDCEATTTANIMRSRAKSAPAVAAGDNLLAFADFSSMPSQQAGFSVMPGEISDDDMHHKHMKMNTKI